MGLHNLGEKLAFPFWYHWSLPKVSLEGFCLLLFLFLHSIAWQSTFNSIFFSVMLWSFVQICEWILYKSSFKPDVICYNLLIDAYGQKSQHKDAESTYLELLEARCIPTEDTYALLLKAYCKSGLFDKAEAIFVEMRKYGLPPSTLPLQFVAVYIYKSCLNLKNQNLIRCDWLHFLQTKYNVNSCRKILILLRCNRVRCLH